LPTLGKPTIPIESEAIITVYQMSMVFMIIQLQNKQSNAILR